jgi:beta-lactamase regulating signal transducer with metallopeptidase domain
MTAGWVVYALVTGALIALSASALEGLARARRWPTRWIWAGSMLTSLLVIGGSLRSGGDAVSVTIAETTPGIVRTAGPVGGSLLARVLADVQGGVASAILAGMATIARWMPAWIDTAASMLWVIGSAIALGLLVAVHLRLQRVRRAWPTTELHGRQVRIAPSVGPAVIGLRRPEIVVPRWLLERAAEEQRLVLAHETEHVRARDHLLLGGACVVVALMPWHPAAWWSLARLRLALELDCDARVLRGGTSARSYGEMLIDLAGQCSGFRVGATALADKTSHLERRLLAMRPTTKRFTPLRVATLCVAAALSLAAACEARVPTSAEIEGMDAAGAERLAQKAGLLTATHAAVTGNFIDPKDRWSEFYVNDVKVTAAEAHAIAPNDIATVNIEKGTKGTSVRIQTMATSLDGSRFRSAAPAGTVTANKSASAPRVALHEKMRLSSHEFSGIILINGVRADAAALHALDPQRIAAIEVVKGAAAMRAVDDPAAKNGIIRVTTK